MREHFVVWLSLAVVDEVFDAISLFKQLFIHVVTIAIPPRVLRPDAPT